MQDTSPREATSPGLRTSGSTSESALQSAADTCELTILMPCLNEAETLEVCVRKARAYLERTGIDGEVLIADNGSTDGSQELAVSSGARVVAIPARGYGAALIGGIKAARGTYVIMGDADDSYDFEHLDAFVDELRAGTQLVMGNRFTGGIAPGAMPPLHRYLGNPVLSAIGRLFFRTQAKDFHCGLRGFDRHSMLDLDLQTTGMEFASEMVVKSVLGRLSIGEVPTTLKKDGRSRPPHLRSWRDGWRHLRFLLIYSPRWLFLYPGLLATGVGALLSLILMIGPISLGSVGLDVSTLIYTAALTIIGYQAVLFSVITKVFAAHERILPVSSRFAALAERLSLERGLVLGGGLFLLGIIVALIQVVRWSGASFGDLDPRETVRVAVPAMLGLVLGFQTVMFSMFIGILTIPTLGSIAVPRPRP